MTKLHILSNRLPFSVKKNDEKIELTPSVGGLATGMKSVYGQFEGSWIGWPGVELDTCTTEQLLEMNAMLKEEKCIPVHLTHNETLHYYEGFCNKTIWPLFHYFTQYAEYDAADWESYVNVNRKFADAALSIIGDDDYIWIHDYHLLLVPQMIKEAKPSVTIGFFLHIPFPSFEVFRLLPWRMEILNGLLGADLIGFHTFDYERHFFSCVRRLIGYDITLNHINAPDRLILVDAFPMGIDYMKFHESSRHLDKQSENEKSDFTKQLEDFILQSPDRKLILSIDRMDYTKGIPHRLKAFANFLQNYPEYRQKVTLIMLAVPSRDEVEHYQLLKKEVDELVGKINGMFGDINYTPIWYFYRSMPYQNLVELYHACDVALITPVRDGMNLVAKEYVAARTGIDGCIILSEMAGAAKELGEAILVNPNNDNEIAEAIRQAISMPADEQQERMERLQDRIKRYDVFKWAAEFVNSMHKVQHLQSEYNTRRVTPAVVQTIVEKYRLAAQRVIFLDYDGTLMPFFKTPQEAKPDQQVLNIIKQLTLNPKNLVTIISGRDKDTLGKWFDNIPVNLIAEHGVWIKRSQQTWQMPQVVNNKWMDGIRPLLEGFVDRTPGTFIETKNYSLVWHYRKAEPEQGEKRAKELKDELTHLISNMNLEIMEGNKVIEVKNGGINKGSAALQFLGTRHHDFIIAIGDDYTDEYMFRELPANTISIKVGHTRTNASYQIDSVAHVRAVLEILANT
ncbi:MAG: bifunctional alpha,alpha-trehalose-phosphate synthase (UDP-forming)/trehalose-phosphatase [Marinilabiliaceae bacterium]|nr:bifunctional alpha,alpha-trehalose-phosphate synthase (UDP-forming)/trehalose-phosphatase [Marinilabiliaceae bacterium]